MYAIYRVCVCVCVRIECLENQRTNLKLVRNVERPEGAAVARLCPPGGNIPSGLLFRANTPVYGEIKSSAPPHLPSTPATLYSVVGAFEKCQRTEDGESLCEVYNIKYIIASVPIYIILEVSWGDVARTSIKITNIYRNRCLDQSDDRLPRNTTSYPNNIYFVGRPR